MGDQRSGEVRLEIDHPELGRLRMRFPANEAKQIARLLQGLRQSEGPRGVEEPQEVLGKRVTMLDLPSPEEIAEYIEGKGGKMIHASYEIQEFFFNRRLKYPQEKTVERRFSERHRKARELLEQKYGGKFEGEWRTRTGTPPYRIYEFSKDIGPPRNLLPPGHQDEPSSPFREPETTQSAGSPSSAGEGVSSPGGLV